MKGIYILMLFCLIHKSLYMLHLLCTLHALSLSRASLSDNFPVVQLLCRVRLFATPWTIAHQVLLSMGFPRQEYWSGLSFSSPGHLPDSGIKHVAPALADEFFFFFLTTEPPGKPDHLPTFCQNFSLPTISIATSAFVWLPGRVLSIPLLSTIPRHFWCISCVKVTHLEVLPSSSVREL